MHYVVYNVWPVVYRKLSMSCFTMTGFVLNSYAMSNRQQPSSPSFQDVTLACDDNRNIQTHKVILVAISRVHEEFKGKTNIHTLSST